MFSPHLTLRRSFLDDEEALQRRFMSAGFIHIVLLPFVAAFMTMHFFLLNAQEWRDKKHFLGPREWSPIARWSFREFNELPHVFEARLAASRAHADTYLKFFPRPCVAALARCVAFISGAFLAVLLALAAVLDGGDAILLYIKLGDRNLLWCVGAASAIFAVSRTVLPDDVDRITCENSGISAAEIIMRRIAEHTHCFPEEWRGWTHTYDVRDAFAHAFRYKAWLFFDEVMSVAFAPLVLCFSLSASAASILRFVRENSVTIDGLGSVLGQSLTDFDRFTNVTDNVLATRLHPTQRGRMEGSSLSFTVNYPKRLDDKNIDFLSSAI